MLPLDGFKDQKVFFSKENVTAIQLIIKEALDLWRDDLERQDGLFYFGKKTGASKEILPCIKGAQDKRHLYSNLMTCLINRVLKLMMSLLRGRTQPCDQVTETFEAIEKICSSRGLTESHQLTKLRLQEVKRELRKLDAENKCKMVMK